MAKPVMHLVPDVFPVPQTILNKGNVLAGKEIKVATSTADFTTIGLALEPFKGTVRFQLISFELLPPQFTLSPLGHLDEAVLESELDKRGRSQPTTGRRSVARMSIGMEDEL